MSIDEDELERHPASDCATRRKSHVMDVRFSAHLRVCQTARDFRFMPVPFAVIAEFSLRRALLRSPDRSPAMPQMRPGVEAL
jgi:hypothetical protein